MLRWRDDPEGGGGEHCNVPTSTVYENQRLGVWLNNQRSAKRGTAGYPALKPEREARLQALVDAGQLW